MSGSLPCFSHISASRDVGQLRITLLIFLCHSINTLMPSNLMTLPLDGDPLQRRPAVWCIPLLTCRRGRCDEAAGLQKLGADCLRNTLGLRFRGDSEE